jgi:hypothetical protein
MQKNHKFSIVGPEADEPVDMRRHLSELAAAMDERSELREGQFVKWKPGCRNRRYPDYGEVVIVREILAQPVFDAGEQTSASPYFMEPLTLRIGLIHDNDFLEFLVDARRFHLVS